MELKRYNVVNFLTNNEPPKDLPSDFCLVYSNYSGPEEASFKIIRDQFLIPEGYEVDSDTTEGPYSELRLVRFKKRSADRRTALPTLNVEATIRASGEKSARLITSEFLYVLLIIGASFEISQPQNYNEVFIKFKNITEAERDIIERYAAEFNGSISLREI